MVEAGSEDCDDGDRQQQAGQREHHVHQPHDRRFHEPAGVSREEAERNADEQRQRDRDEADRERQARAVDQPRQQVAAERVGAVQEARRSAGGRGAGGPAPVADQACAAGVAARCLASRSASAVSVIVGKFDAAVGNTELPAT